MSNPPTPETNQRPLFWQGRERETPQARLNTFHQLGIEQVPLITWNSWRDGVPNEYGHQGVDHEKLNRMLDTSLGGGYGTPADYDGWLCIDIEQNYWLPFRQPEQYDTDAEAISAALIYEEVCLAVRKARPQSRLSLYNMTHLDKDAGYPLRWDLLVSMHALCQGLGPSLYRHSWLTFKQDLRVVGGYCKNAFEIKDMLGLELHAWTWHRTNQGGGQGSIVLDEQEAAEWFGLWTGEGFDGWTMLRGDTAPNWFIRQQRELMK